jgi:signal transduction histidine kinase
MAGNAIGYLHDAALVQPDDGSTVRLRATAQRIADAAAEFARPFKVTMTDVGPRSIPVSVGESIASAAQQAMFNSVQHGGDSPRIRRWVTIKGVRPGGIEIEIGDSGVGFAADAVPTERLGVRVSIIERVTNAGGVARIASSPGHGTIVSLRWPATKSVREAQERAQWANEDAPAEVTK